MVITSRQYMLRSTLAVVLLHLMFLGFTAFAIPALFVPCAIYCIALAAWRLFIAHLNLSFTRYASFFIYANLSAAPLVAVPTVAMLTRSFDSTAIRVLLTLTPAALILLGYLIARQTTPRRKVFSVAGRAVQVDEKPPHRVGWAGLLGGIGALFGSFFAKQENLMPLLAGLMTATGLYLVFYYRDAIAALRTLKLAERQQGLAYAFDNQEEIQAWRSGSFLSRKLNALLGRFTTNRQ